MTVTIIYETEALKCALSTHTQTQQFSHKLCIKAFTDEIGKCQRNHYQ